MPATPNSSNNGRPLCLVTGANAGIGFEIARGLERSEFRVVLACRDRGKGEAARKTISSETRNNDIELLVVDLASQSSIRAAAREFSQKHDALDVLAADIEDNKANLTRFAVIGEESGPRTGSGNCRCRTFPDGRSARS